MFTIAYENTRIDLNRLLLKFMNVIIILRFLGIPGSYTFFSNTFGTYFNYLVMILVFFFIIFCFLSQIRSNVSFSKRNLLCNNNVIIFVVFIFLSILFGSLDYGLAFNAFINLMIIILYSYFLIKKFSLNEVFNILIFDSIIVSLLLLIASFDSSLYNNHGSFTGFYETKNNMAYLITFLMVVFVTSIFTQKNKLIFILFLGIDVYLLFLCDSVGSIFSILLVFMISLLVKIRKKTNLLLVFILFNLVFFSIVLIGNNSQIIQNFMLKIDKDITFSGRTIIWESVLNNYIKYGSILWGYGYESVWLTDSNLISSINAEIFSKSNNTIIGSHNLYIEFLLQVGLIGLIGFVFMIIIGLKRFKYVEDLNHKIIIASFFMFFMIFSLLERTMGLWVYSSFMLFVCIFSLNKAYIDKSV